MPDPYSTLGPPCFGPPRARQGCAMGHQGPCPDCQDAAAGIVRRLPDDFDALSLVVGTRTQTASESAAPGKPGSRPPINVAIDALRTHVVYSAALWEEILRDHCQLSPRRTGAMREKQSLIQSVRIIAPRIDVLTTLPPIDGYFNGPEYGLVRRDGMGGIKHLLRLHQTIRRTLGLEPVTTTLPGHCPTCDTQALTKEDGADTVHCGHCGNRHPYSDYTRYTQLLIGGHL